MRRRLAASLFPLIVLALAGCARFTPPWESRQVYRNPISVRNIDRDCLWDHLVDVVDDYFQIENEDRVRLEGDVLTVGRIETFPQVGATLLQPFANDSADLYQKVESTLQSIRRRAVIQVEPAGDGYFIDVAVYKELEDVLRPNFATAGSATLRHDTSNQHFIEPVSSQAASPGWIPVGRDPALEQRIIARVLERVGQLSEPAGPSWFSKLPIDRWGG